MPYFKITLILLLSLTQLACGPAAIIGAVGSQITKAAYENDAEVNDYSTPVSRGNNSEIALSNLRLGLGYMQEGLYEEALEKLIKAREAKPDYPPTYNALGVLHQKLGINDLAEENFKTAIKLNPNDSSTMNNYGLLLCQTERYAEADEIFLKAVNNPLYATPEVAYNNAGTCALKNGQTEQAENYFREALTRNPSIAPALIQMSQVSYDQAKYLPARAYLSRYLDVSKHTPTSLWLGIRIERKLGDKDALASYSLLLRNQFAESEEAKLLANSSH